MTVKRSFWDKLLGRTTKSVVEKDKNGNIIGKTVYTFDKKTGEIIGELDCAFDPANNSFIKQKNKTYKLGPSGKDPLETTYYDNQGRIQKTNSYHRDTTGMLCGIQNKYTYSPEGEQLLLSREASNYDGGAWTPINRLENKYDSYGHTIQQNSFEYSPSQRGLVCTKEKSFVRNEDQTYDPQTTIYRDLENRVTKRNEYERRQTELSEEPLLFGTSTSYSYGPEGTKKKQNSQVYFLRQWIKEKDFKSIVLNTKKTKTAPTKGTSKLEKRLKEGSNTPSKQRKRGKEQG